MHFSILVFFLRAAHCIVNTNSTIFNHTHVFIGGTDILSLGKFRERISILRIFYPAEYVPGNAKSYDVAVIQLAAPTTAPPVTMITTAPAAGTQLTIIGWGKVAGEVNTTGAFTNILR